MNKLLKLAMEVEGKFKKVMLPPGDILKPSMEAKRSTEEKQKEVGAPCLTHKIKMKNNSREQLDC